MAHPNEALRAALAAAERLPLKLRRQLAERLLSSAATKQNSQLITERDSGRSKGLNSQDIANSAKENITIHLRRLPENKQSRLAELMDKNCESALTSSEQAELKALGDEVDETMLSNSIALARAARPELFDAKGRLIRRRFRHAADRPSRRENTHR